jgi:hypothetical protein
VGFDPYFLRAFDAGDPFVVDQFIPAGPGDLIGKIFVSRVHAPSTCAYTLTVAVMNGGNINDSALTVTVDHPGVFLFTGGPVPISGDDTIAFHLTSACSFVDLVATAVLAVK